MADQKKKLEIEYPCHWDYRVIGADKVLIPQNIEIILENFNYSYSKSNQSTTGKYTSFSITVHVADENERNHIFGMLQKIPTVRMVI